MHKLTGLEIQVDGETTFYLEGGPSNGPLLIFIHGWPDIAETWMNQLIAFASFGFRVVAPDMRGYGKSSAPRDVQAYRLECLVPEQLALLKHLGRSQAVWIGHDWGCGVVSALVAHHPEACVGVVLLGVAYRTAELGLDHLVSLVNRETYPEAEHPYGQWAYMKFYEENPEKADQVFEAYPAKSVKAIFSPTDPATFRSLSPTALVLRDGGWFGGNPENLPDIPLEKTLLDELHFNNLVRSLETNGFFPGSAYYRNHKLNKAYDESKQNDGVLDMPVLYIDAKYDRICSAVTSPKHLDGMRKACRDLTVHVVESGHWVHMQAATEVNAKIAQWVARSLPEYWPWHLNKDPAMA